MNTIKDTQAASPKTIMVKVLKTPITDRYCKVGDYARLDTENNQIMCGGAWFTFDTERWEVVDAIEDSKINYSAAYGVSEAVFTQKASEVLNVPIDRVEVRRNIMSGKSFGTLHVIVYEGEDQEKAYYRLNNKATHYDNLPSNIYEFEEDLKWRNENNVNCK
jgi:hypothetical protein